jgi:hypothetical protein
MCRRRTHKTERKGQHEEDNNSKDMEEGDLREKIQPDRKGGLIWYTDGSKTNKGTGAGVYCDRTRQKLSFSLGQYTTIFQAEVYAIKACAVENLPFTMQ